MYNLSKYGSQYLQFIHLMQEQEYRNIDQTIHKYVKLYSQIT